jgi:hypothetical protein
MDCSDIKVLLSEYIDGTLDRETKDRVEQHVASCADCREELASLKALVHELGSLEPVQPPEDFLAQVHKRLDKPSRFSKLFGTLFLPFRIKWPLQVAGAAAMAILVLSLVYFQQEEFKAPLVTPREDKQADEVAGTEDRATARKAKPAFERTALKATPQVARPIEVALLLRRDLTPRAYEPVKAVEMPPPAKKAQRETLGARRTLPSADVEGRFQEEKSTGAEPSAISGGHAEEDKARPELAEEYDPVMALKHLIGSVHGTVLSTHYDAETNEAQDLLAEIPASQWSRFKDQLKSLGDLREPAEPAIHKGQETLQVRIRLLPRNHDQRN